MLHKKSAIPVEHKNTLVFEEVTHITKMTSAHWRCTGIKIEKGMAVNPRLRHELNVLEDLPLTPADCFMAALVTTKDSHELIKFLKETQHSLAKTPKKHVRYTIPNKSSLNELNSKNWIKIGTSIQRDIQTDPSQAHFEISLLPNVRLTPKRCFMAALAKAAQSKTPEDISSSLTRLKEPTTLRYTLPKDLSLNDLTAAQWKVTARNIVRDTKESPSIQRFVLSVDVSYPLTPVRCYLNALHKTPATEVNDRQRLLDTISANFATETTTSRENYFYNFQQELVSVLNVGDNLYWPDGKQYTVALVRTGKGLIPCDKNQSQMSTPIVLDLRARR